MEEKSPNSGSSKSRFQWVNRGCKSCYAFVSETVQWKRPVASSVFLMLVNACFWLFVFYGSRVHHFYCLGSLLLVILVWDTVQWIPVFHLHCKSIGDQFGNDFADFRQKSLLTKLVLTGKYVLFVAPGQIVLVPVVYYLFCWIYWKTPEICLMVLSSWSLQLLCDREVELACWSAYCLGVGTLGSFVSVVIALVTPPIRRREVASRCADFIAAKLLSVMVFVENYFIRPTFQLLSRLFSAAKYAILFRWVPPLIRHLEATWFRLKTFIVSHFWPPLCQKCRTCWSWAVYIACFRWLPPLARLAVAKLAELKQKIWNNTGLPTFDTLRRFWRALTYVFLAKWIPPLIEWTKTKVLRPTWRALVGLKNGLVYAVCFKWLPGLLGYLWSLMFKLAGRCKRNLLLPLLDYCRLQKRRFLSFLRHSLWDPAVSYLFYLKAETSRFVREDVLTPAFDWLKETLRQSLIFLWVNALYPTWIVTEVWLCRSKHYVQIELLEPAIEWIRERLPEKSPFVDDTDTELKDLLPTNTNMSSRQTPADSSDEEEIGLPSEKNNRESSALVPAVGKSQQQQLNDDSDEEEDADFSRGLNFPAVDSSGDSSDDEFSLRRSTGVQRRRVDLNGGKTRTEKAADSGKLSPPPPSANTARQKQKVYQKRNKSPRVREPKASTSRKPNTENSNERKSRGTEEVKMPTRKPGQSQSLADDDQDFGDDDFVLLG